MKKNILKRSIGILMLFVLTGSLQAQSLSEKLAKVVIKSGLDTSTDQTAKLSYDQSVLLEGMAGVWKRTGDADYYRYILHQMDHIVDQNGTIKNNQSDDQNVKNARALLLLYRVTGLEKYYKALTQLRGQQKSQALTPESLYQTQPFSAEYAAVFNQPADFDVIVKPFVLVEKQLYNPKTTPVNLGWYGMALVDVLEYLPENHPQQKILLDILSRYAGNIQKYAGIKPDGKGNSTSAAMFAYTLAKGVRLGLLPEKYQIIAQKSADIIKATAETDIKNTGLFLLAANELELTDVPQNGKNQTVMLDSYFNNEFMKNAAGQTIPFHYKWDEMDNNGFYFFKNVFNYRGVKTATLSETPSAQNLKGADIYIIVDPDTQKETEKPNYVNEQDAIVVSNWVKAGGVLVILANDAGNCDLSYLNILTEKFGMHFNEDSRNKVTGNQFEMGALKIPASDPIFKTAKKVYIKEISTLKLTPPAVASFTEGKDNIIATAKYGKGTVFAVGDPWFYDEYTDGRKLPADFDNFKACQDLVNWLIKQVPAKAK